MIKLLVLLNLSVFSASIDILKNDFNAISSSLSGANSSIQKGVYSINSNPAGLIFGQKAEFVTSISNGFEDARYSYFGSSFEFPINFLNEKFYPQVGFSLYLSDLGNMKVRTIDNNGIISEKNINSEKDLVFSIAYSEKTNDEITHLTPSKKSRFEGGLGFGIKFIKSKLLSKYSARALAIDIGYTAKLEDLGLNFGISVVNIGNIKYLDEKNKLPQTIRASVSYSKPTILENKTTLYLGYDNYIADKAQSWKVGFEYLIENIFSFRSGYNFLHDNKGLSLGVSLYAGKFSFDISTSFTSVYKYSFLSISYRIPKEEKLKEKKKTHLEKFKEKQKEKEPDLPQPSKERVIIVF